MFRRLDTLLRVCAEPVAVTRPLTRALDNLKFHSPLYVTTDKIYCVYITPNEELIREHARRGGFPANSVARVSTIDDPTTAEA